MKRKDKLKVIHNALKLIAPDREYSLSDYDIFCGYDGGYIQVYSIHKSIYVESDGTEVPTEIKALFKLHKLSDIEATKVYDIIERNDALINIIGVPNEDMRMYKATPIDKDLFKTI